jgi:Family of unknown function (DUF6338)
MVDLLFPADLEILARNLLAGFSRRTEPGHRHVAFRDGAQVHGYFGNRSLAASDPRRSDIFLERLYTVR